MTTALAYEEFIDFLAAGTTPQSIIDYKPSQQARDRIAELLQRHKSDGLPPDEESELNHFLEIEHLMRMAKARARKNIANA